MNTPKFCEFCGAPLAPGMRFCEACGQAVPGAGTPQSSGAPPEREYNPDATVLASRPVFPPPQPPPAPRPVYSPPPPVRPPAPVTPPKPRSNRTFLVVILVLLVVGCLCCAAAGVAAYFYFAPAYSSTFESIIPETIVESDSTAVPIQVTEVVVQPTKELSEATATSEPAPVETEVPPANQANVSFEGVSFYLDPRIASSADGKIVPGSTGPDLPNWELGPDYLSFSFSGYAVPDHFHTPAILIYPVDAYTQTNPDVEATFTKFKDVMGDRPVISPTGGMPFLPMWNAAQVMATQISYFKFQNGSGVRYLTQFGQDVYPINSNSLFYTFQGMTDDGKWYIAAIMPATTIVLPDPEPLVQDPNFYDNYPKYLDETQMMLGALPPEMFTPDLSVLDELFGSLLVSK